MPRNEAPSIRAIREQVAPVMRKHGVLRAGIFGSAVRGELRADSDVDIVVELPADKTLLDLVALKLEIEERLGRKADVVEYAALHPLLRDRIMAEQVTLA